MPLSLHPQNRNGGERSRMMSGGFSRVLEMLEVINRGAKSRCYDATRKKFEKTLKKIWKGREKRFIFASAFATRNGGSEDEKKKSSLTILT